MTPPPEHTPADAPHPHLSQQAAHADDGEDSWGYESALPYLQGSCFCAEGLSDAPPHSGRR